MIQTTCDFVDRPYDRGIHACEVGKEMKTAVMTILLLIALVGCTTMYVHPDATEQKWAADYGFCSAQGGQASGVNDPYGIVRERTTHNCLVGKGWTKQ